MLDTTFSACMSLWRLCQVIQGGRCPSNTGRARRLCPRIRTYPPLPGAEERARELLRQCFQDEANEVLTGLAAELGVDDPAYISTVRRFSARDKRWARQFRTAPLQACVTSDGEILDSAERSFTKLAEHWSQAARARPIDRHCAKEFLREFAPPIRLRRWIMSKDDFGLLVSKLHDSGHGPDGIPNAAWRHCGSVGCDHLYALYLRGYRCDHDFTASFNNAFLYLLPKDDHPGDTVSCARRAEDTRPMCASNSDQKVIETAYNHAYKLALPSYINGCQRGFVAGRVMLDNVILFDAYMRICATLPGAQSFAILFDFANAFGSVEWEFIMLLLKQIQVPRAVRSYLQKLLKDAGLVMKFRGITKQICTVLCGVKQGGPASASFFIQRLASWSAVFTLIRILLCGGAIL